MSKVVADFKLLTLDAQLQAYPEITAVLNFAKDAWRLQHVARIAPSAPIRPVDLQPLSYSSRLGAGAKFVCVLQIAR